MRPKYLSEYFLGLATDALRLAIHRRRQGAGGRAFLVMARQYVRESRAAHWKSIGFKARAETLESRIDRVAAIFAGMSARGRS